MKIRATAVVAFVLSAELFCSCSNARKENRSGDEARRSLSASSTTSPSATPAPSASVVVDPLFRDPMAIHHETRAELIRLFEVPHPSRLPNVDVDAFLAATFGPDGPTTSNQGNKALAQHTISKGQCLAGLANIELDTEQTRSVCGQPFMVPIFDKGDPSRARTCIDLFEFPDKPCELPFVWIAATQAREVCEIQGKRLCRQEEWELACAGDPEGGPDRKYSYGDELDLTVCNTNKPAAEFGPDCVPDSPKTAWATCATNTEPTGSFPRCRSRFGVFDMQGNVAEIMTRLDPDGHVYDQLKGSAFFYTDVARDEFGRAPKGRPPIKPERMRGTYPDICKYNARWHIEPIANAWHVNYHLGFRCCRDIPPRAG